MTIEQKISQSTAFKKLLRLINTPYKNKLGPIITLFGTTFDTQKLILKLLEKEARSTFIYSTIESTNIHKYLESSTVYNVQGSTADSGANNVYPFVGSIISNGTNLVTYTKLKTIRKKYNFTRAEKVTDHGEYSQKGDIISFWPSLYDHPIRINFFGENIESAEIYDEVFQKKITSIWEIALGNESLLEDDVERQALNISSYNLPINPKILTFGTKSKNAKNHINFHFTYPSLFFNRLDLLQKEIGKRKGEDWLVAIETVNHDQLPAWSKPFILKQKQEFNAGFENAKLKIAVYTDRELFGTIFISKEKQRSKKSINKYLAQLEGEIKIGDYIVHEDYGIAHYRGILQKEVLGRQSDYLILEYAQNDRLSVPISQVHKLTKYIGPDANPPKITRLGKTNWPNIKRKVKAKIAILASELVKHYAQIELARIDKFNQFENEDEFAEKFEYTETPDQKRAISEILHDLSKTHPMNRLLVGDVGFGKTEVAIRAAFKAIMNGYQVAVLCPTTILVSQHYSVFKHRMKDYPIQIATLSRFGTKAENAKIVEDVNAGNIDIVIGTHRLLSNDIKFDNLGLIVVDEEQRFGVAQKEKIKKLALNSHVLSMSATPIPRTLSMALSSLRDISIITTPPPGRKAIKTSVKPFDIRDVANAIQKEVKRGGQVYLVHNEVRSIESIKAKLQNLLPQIRFKVAHGQMHPQTLEKTMREFYEKKFDCLVCTTIIENGIDIPNVNTIIINKAERFGLSQLYQLRGRVGRSKRQAYCYLFYTQKKLFAEKTILQEEILKGKDLPFEKARARLEAILESQDLGSGFKIASRDLEIRGAGNLLGREQHGNISAVGLGLYTQLLADEVERLRKITTN